MLLPELDINLPISPRRARQEPTWHLAFFGLLGVASSLDNGVASPLDNGDTALSNACARTSTFSIVTGEVSVEEKASVVDESDEVQALGLKSFGSTGEEDDPGERNRERYWYHRFLYFNKLN